MLDITVLPAKYIATVKIDKKWDIKTKLFKILEMYENEVDILIYIYY